MIIFKKAEDLQQYIDSEKKRKAIIGFVPTMGALHDGHISLLQHCTTDNDVSVCSIFINPTQFNNPEDFKKYPVTIEKDLEQLLANGCTALFLPSVEEVYPKGHQKKQYNLGELETLLEGRYRPGHFQGVCEVVDRLLSLVQPDRLYLGQKDYQQCMVIKKMIEDEYNGNIELKTVPTVREKSGLAMSSRNMRLNGEQQQQAAQLYQTLLFTKNNILEKDPTTLEQIATKRLSEQGFMVDYVAIANSQTLQPVLQKEEPKVALLAASINNVRLIDNLILS